MTHRFTQDILHKYFDIKVKENQWMVQPSSSSVAAATSYQLIVIASRKQAYSTFYPDVVMTLSKENFNAKTSTYFLRLWVFALMSMYLIYIIIIDKRFFHRFDTLNDIPINVYSSIYILDVLHCRSFSMHARIAWWRERTKISMRCLTFPFHRRNKSLKQPLMLVRWLTCCLIFLTCSLDCFLIKC